jgi:predicted RNA binding protein YcfA (HicA-like mRNA interferase family)
MTPERPPLALLRHVPVRRIIQALEHEGFQCTERKGSQRVYRHPERGRVVIHDHTGNRPLTRTEIRNLLMGTGWAEEDLRRLDRVR